VSAGTQNARHGAGRSKRRSVRRLRDAGFWITLARLGRRRVPLSLTLTGGDRSALTKRSVRVYAARDPRRLCAGARPRPFIAAVLARLSLSGLAPVEGERSAQVGEFKRAPQDGGGAS
jgi:hypothetical protein